ncbi:MAG: hypothetical protein ACKOB2_07820 [Solirubrobacterales bacterium]
MTWLAVVTVGVIAFGLLLVIAPGVGRQGFSLLVFSSADRISEFGSEAASYIELAHAVMGSVMGGWGVALLLVLRGPMKRNLTEGLKIFAVSLVAWFIPDTIFSIASGFWENAVQNVVFAVLFAVPLTALYRQSRKT